MSRYNRGQRCGLHERPTHVEYAKPPRVECDGFDPCNSGDVPELVLMLVRRLAAGVV